ncbi:MULTISPECIES: hypothetical protein [Shewanella]|uniref:Uncharacterized protein n=1 Tax=Shewanella carassii TaxID=1987584 RepID=A0ABQ1SYL1_9GAMM|nr:MULTISPECIES: hypothetical protein [Shewanella]QTE91395.1 hypothetical protein JKK33_03060 [Shewanella algae]BCV65237.1 hypothetical protein TUM17387_05960 [Shewanella carassii]GGE71439.1 hypothetical protein GCM10011520_10080 [Shewanella carassii]
MSMYNKSRNKHRRYRLLSQLLVWSIVGALILMVSLLSREFMSVGIWGSPFLWLDAENWSWVLTLITAMLALVWAAMTFSVLAVVCVLCVAAALLMFISGFAMIWPVLILALAVWGIGKSSQWQE